MIFCTVHASLMQPVFLMSSFTQPEHFLFKLQYKRAQGLRGTLVIQYFKALVTYAKNKNKNK